MSKFSFKFFIIALIGLAPFTTHAVGVMDTDSALLCGKALRGEWSAIKQQTLHGKEFMTDFTAFANALRNDHLENAVRVQTGPNAILDGSNTDTENLIHAAHEKLGLPISTAYHTAWWGTSTQLNPLLQALYNRDMKPKAQAPEGWDSKRDGEYFGEEYNKQLQRGFDWVDDYLRYAEKGSNLLAHLQQEIMVLVSLEMQIKKFVKEENQKRSKGLLKWNIFGRLKTKSIEQRHFRSEDSASRKTITFNVPQVEFDAKTNKFVVLGAPEHGYEYDLTAVGKKVAFNDRAELYTRIEQARKDIAQILGLKEGPMMIFMSLARKAWSGFSFHRPITIKKVINKSLFGLWKIVLNSFMLPVHSIKLLSGTYSWFKGLADLEGDIYNLQVSHAMQYEEIKMLKKTFLARANHRKNIEFSKKESELLAKINNALITPTAAPSSLGLKETQQTLLNAANSSLEGSLKGISDDIQGIDLVDVSTGAKIQRLVKDQASYSYKTRKWLANHATTVKNSLAAAVLGIVAINNSDSVVKWALDQPFIAVPYYNSQALYYASYRNIVGEKEYYHGLIVDSGGEQRDFNVNEVTMYNWVLKTTGSTAWRLRGQPADVLLSDAEYKAESDRVIYYMTQLREERLFAAMHFDIKDRYKKLAKPTASFRGALHILANQHPTQAQYLKDLEAEYNKPGAYITDNLNTVIYKIYSETSGQLQVDLLYTLLVNFEKVNKVYESYEALVSEDRTNFYEEYLQAPTNYQVLEAKTSLYPYDPKLAEQEPLYTTKYPRLIKLGAYRSDTPYRKMWIVDRDSHNEVTHLPPDMELYLKR